METTEPHSPPSSRLRILHLEDTPSDRELIRLSLQADGVACDITYAASQAEFEAALAGSRFDLILSDFTLPGYHGSHALAFAHALYPDIPYVFVSGTIGEDRAIESLKAGATDYVLKEHLERLIPAVRRALREAEERARSQAAGDALRQSEERFREMAETIQDVFWAATPEARRFLYVSPAYADLWHRPVDALYARAEEWIDSVIAGDRARLLAARADLAKGCKYLVEYRIARPDGSVRWIEERGYPVFSSTDELQRILGVAVDITERKELQAQLIQAQKMEAVGLLAGGVAHDFNNLLSVINGYAQMMIDANAVGPEALQQLKQIYAAGRRAANLTRQLLVFSRRQVINQQVIDLNAVVAELTKMLGRLIGEQIKVELRLFPQLPRISADAGMTEQVIVNLAVNARDAMPQGGTLSITTDVTTVREKDPRPPERRPGEYVRLSLRDTGCGIPPENLRRIFEPFFTTKPAGQGTGLGLATVFAIVQQHHGWVDLDSAVGQGTVFQVHFPAVARGGTAHPFGGDIRAVRGRQETILLVEDDAAVRECASALLSHYGYRVLQASTGAQALELWQRHESSIRLLLTDVVLPGRTTGIQLAEALRLGRPDLKVILTSGYRHAVKSPILEMPGRVRLLDKPYDLATLTRVVRELLDEPAAGPAQPQS